MARLWAAFERGRHQGFEHFGAQARGHALRARAELRRQVAGSQLRRHRAAQLFFQGRTMLGQPQVQVGFGAAGKVVQQVALADDLHHRRINGLVPVAGGFWIRDLALLFLAHEITVNGNVRFQGGILAGRGHAQINLRALLIQAAALQKNRIFGFQDQIFGADIWRERNAALHLGHVGLDVGCAKPARHRDAMVAITDKIGLAYLVHLNGGKPLHAVGGHLYPGPAARIHGIARQKVAPEILVAVDAADDAGQRDLLGGSAGAYLGFELQADLIEREQLGVFASQPRHQIAQRSLLAGFAKILDGIPQAKRAFSAHPVYLASDFSPGRCVLPAPGPG